MEFIEMSGKTLLKIVDHYGPNPAELVSVGVTDESIVRINRQGDIELRRLRSWDVIGGLLGDFDDQVHEATHLDWA